METSTSAQFGAQARARNIPAHVLEDKVFPKRISSSDERHQLLGREEEFAGKMQAAKVRNRMGTSVRRPN